MAVSKPIDQPICFRHEKPRSCRKIQHFLSMAGADVPAAPATAGLRVPERSWGLKDQRELRDGTQQQAEIPSPDLEAGFIPSTPLLRFCRGYGMSSPHSHRHKAVFDSCSAPSRQDPATLQSWMMDPITQRLLRSMLGSFGMKCGI